MSYPVIKNIIFDLSLKHEEPIPNHSDYMKLWWALNALLHENFTVVLKNNGKLKCKIIQTFFEIFMQ